MKKRLMSLLVVAAFIAVFASPVWAGVEPSPFQPEINKLGAVSLVLEAVYLRLDDTLQPPPDDDMPATDGTIGKLEAMVTQLDVLNNRVGDVIDRTPPPDDNHPPEPGIVAALTEIVEGAQDVIRLAEGPPPDDIIVGALADVQDAALGIIDTANTYLVPGPELPPDLPPAPVGGVY
jgi:hypothetical protein